MKKTWWKESVVYQIYPRSFCDSNGDGIGDLNGILSKLDYLKELGIDVIWLSPVYQSPNDDNGYDISDYQAIMAEFGTMEDFDRLLFQIHKLGMRLVMDLVVNHTSDEHPWFTESRNSRDNPYRDYYIWREGNGNCPPNNWGSVFGGSAWEFDEHTNMYYLHLFSKKQPDLNWENPTVREEVFQMMKWWLDKGIDGFRMDVISMISKTPGLPNGPVQNGLYGDASPYTVNGPRVHEYLQQMNREVLSRYDVMTVGETPGVTVEEARKYAGEEGNELSMVFQFEHMGLDDHPLGFKWNDTPPKLVKLKATLSKWQTELAGKAWNSLYWSNHDQPRAVSRFGDDSPKHRVQSAKMLATCLHMMQGTPYIYQGEELGMTNTSFETISQYRDIESLNAFRELTGNGILTQPEMLRYLRRKSRDNARTPMQWDDTLNAGFTTGEPWIEVNPNYPQINAKQQIADPDSVYRYYQKLIRLRKIHGIIVYGSYELLDPNDETIFAYTRKMEGQKLLCACNFSSREEVFFPPEEFIVRPGVCLIDNAVARYCCESQMTLQPYEAFVYLI